MPLTIQYCSDLHLEFPLNVGFMHKHPLAVKGDILVLAGDVVPFAVMDGHRAFFDFLADNYEQTYWIPGNHEYYHADIAERSGTVNEQIRSNVRLVNNIVVTHGDVQLICSTLWSKINPIHEWQIERAMSDFHVIKYKGYRYSIPVFNELHDECVAFIKQAIAGSHAQKKVVVTHHVPTFMHYPEKYKTSILNEAFATELYELIAGAGLHSWIYGHHHCNTADFKIGNTWLLTNQLGYVHHGEHTDFNNAKTIVVDDGR
jgi:predicted phosphohydrolase